VPNSFGRLWQSPRLTALLASAKGPVAFVDESFLSPAQHHDSFYILCATIVPKSNLKILRERLLETVQAPRWHTTEAGRTEGGRQQIRALARTIASLTSNLITVVDQLSDLDRNAEAGREQAKRAMLNELATNHLYLSGTVVFEKRPGGSMHQRDLRTLRIVREGLSPAAKLHIHSIKTKAEPLLWAPDLVAWCYRKAYFEKDSSFLQDLERTITVLRI
jgi:hypothetical protein